MQSGSNHCSAGAEALQGLVLFIVWALSSSCATDIFPALAFQDGLQISG
jgi:hypothetical protein